jgi:hypothetical protein
MMKRPPTTLPTVLLPTTQKLHDEKGHQQHCQLCCCQQHRNYMMKRPPTTLPTVLLPTTQKLHDEKATNDTANCAAANNTETT